MNKYQEDYVEFIEGLKYIDELVDSLTIEQRKSLGATTWSIQGVLGRYINEEKDFIKELMDKETPMKPIELIDDERCTTHNCCPKCEVEVDAKYCSECGQRVDWSSC